MKNTLTKKYNYSNILVTGSVAYDEIMDFPFAFKDFFDPTKLHQINISFVVERLEKQIGGIATNIAYNLHLLLKEKKKIKLLAAVGKDGQIFIDWLKEKNIPADGVLIDQNLYTACGKVVTDIKDNQIWSFYYGACAMAKNINLSNYSQKKNVLVISANHEDAFLNFQNQAIDNKIDYFYDPGMALTWIKPKELKEGVYNCRWLVGNDYEIGRILKILETNIITLNKKGVDVITTLGEKGVTYQSYKCNYNVPAFKLKKIIDPTGAGDAWRAGFIAGIVENKSIEESLKWGNAMASFAVEKYGTINHKPTKKEILNRAKLL